MNEVPIDKDLVNTWHEFLMDDKIYSVQNTKYKGTTYYYNTIQRIADNFPKERSLYVNFVDIEYYNEELAQRFLDKPIVNIRNAEKAIHELLPADVDVHIYFRVTKIPHVTNLCTMNRPPNSMVSLNVMVRRVKQKYRLCTHAAFRCNKCGYQMIVPQPEDNRIQFREPLKCMNENCDREATSSTSFDFLPGISEFIDAEDDVLEDPRDTVTGPEPYQFDVVMHNDLCQRVQPGQRIVIHGLHKIQQRTTKQGAKTKKFDSYIEAQSIENLDERYDVIEISKEDIEQIKALSKKPNLLSLIKGNVAPFIFGLDDIKEGLALFLFGGVEKTGPHGEHLRGDIHVFLVGDPGLGKSQLLKYIATISPKAIYTSGRGSTEAGLTATAKQDQDGWYIEAGALPMADRGICCIDELDKMRTHDRDSIHEAMEQQSISISKAAITAVLLARCGILAAANPKEGRFNYSDYILPQIDLGPQTHVLLSRFGLIYPFEDEINEKIDRKMAEHILDYAADLTMSMRDKDSKSRAESKERLELPIPLDLFVKYIAYAKRHIFPVLPQNCRQMIIDYYVEERQKGKNDKTDGEFKRIALTPRQIEDIQRLAEATARMRLSQKVSPNDMTHAIRVFNHSMMKVARDHEGRFDMDLIYSGKTTSSRNKVSQIFNVISSEQKRFDNGCPIKALQDYFVKNPELKITESDLHEAIEILLSKGEIFQPTYRKDTVMTKN